MRVTSYCRFLIRVRPRFGTTRHGWWLMWVHLPRLIALRNRASWEGLRKLLVAVTWFMLPHKRPEPTESTYKRRRGACRGCPLFNRAAGTCGTAGRSYWDPQTRQDKDLGCFCLMALKAATPCNCWAYDVTKGAAGWPAKLNSYPYE